MLVNTKFDMNSDAKGRDPDSSSPTLKKYHQMLWSKKLPNGSKLNLIDGRSNYYLYGKSKSKEFFFGSDAITNSYKNHKKKKWIVEQAPNEVEELFKMGSTIGAYIIFPNNRINGGHTINQARGINSLIDDRIDLTLECIRLFYLGIESPLYDTLLKYKDFFDLFENFIGYIQFFLLDDMLDNQKKIKFFLPYDNFKTHPNFSDINDYKSYQKKVIEFIKSRNMRIENYIRNNIY